MNGQHLRSLPEKELTKLIGGRWRSAGILKESEGPFVEVRYLLPRSFSTAYKVITDHLAGWVFAIFILEFLLGENEIFNCSFVLHM